MTLARLTSAGVVDDPTDGALWYHADYVKPHWADAKEQVARIGRHIFYTLPEPKNVQVSENLDRIDMPVITR
jgi:spore germination cell wall hydrolase CwlJ-like protein